jgi:endonuclease III
MGIQEKLLDVPVSAAQSEAEHYADMAAFVRQKAEELKAQAEIVLEKMKDSGQRKLDFIDDYKTHHFFEIVDKQEKLKYQKKD